MKYHTDNVPSTIPSLHTWIRLRENLQFLADASVRGRKTIYYRYFSITYNRFSFGLNKYEIEQGQREREREKFHRNIGRGRRTRIEGREKY